jgi:hypothetical protein
MLRRLVKNTIFNKKRLGSLSLRAKLALREGILWGEAIFERLCRSKMASPYKNPLRRATFEQSEKQPVNCSIFFLFCVTSVS